MFLGFYGQNTENCERGLLAILLFILGVEL
jgi:hypothetical protein